MKKHMVPVISWAVGCLFGITLGAFFFDATRGSDADCVVTNPSDTSGFSALDPWIQQVITEVYEAAVSTNEKSRLPRSWNVTNLQVVDRLEHNDREINCFIGVSLSGPGFRLHVRGSSLPEGRRRVVFHPVIDIDAAIAHRKRIVHDFWNGSDVILERYVEEILKNRDLHSMIPYPIRDNMVAARRYIKDFIQQSFSTIRSRQPSLCEQEWRTVHMPDGMMFHSWSHTDEHDNYYGVSIETNGFGEVVTVSAESGHRHYGSPVSGSDS